MFFFYYLYLLFGEQIIGASAGLFIPTWLFEGDAVCTENALSNYGIGRSPNFEMGLRTQILNKKLYS